MIFLEAARSQLSPLEQFGLMVLADLSGLLPVRTRSDNVVSLEVAGGPAAAIGQPLIFTGAPGTVTVARATLAQLASVAGAVAEQQSVAQDRHGRVPSEVNANVAAGLTQSPWVNAAARSLREAVLAQAGSRAVRTIAPWPGGHRWAAAFTHDLDVVRHWPLFTGLRLLELARKGEVSQALRVSGKALTSALGDPVRAGVREILAIEREHEITSTWFIIAGVPSVGSTLKGDVTYSVDSSAARAILAAIASSGHEIGLHGSFATFLDAGVMAEERERLRKATGAPVTGIRQHFLRMRPDATPSAMREAGFAYDSTFGFPDRNGFRLGAAGVVPCWDHRATRPMDLEEAPLTWMDRALSKYAGIENPASWVDEGLELARKAESEEGLWVGLWHPNLTGTLGFPGAPRQFRRLVETIQSRRPYLASLSSIVEWRKARRSLAARSVSAEGIPQLEAHSPGSWTVILEDGLGNRKETQLAGRRMTARRWWQTIQVFAGLLVVFFVARQFWKDWDSIREVRIEWEIRPLLLLLSAAVTLTMYGLLIAAWRLLLRDWGQQLEAWTAARIWTIANLGKYIPGKVWAIAGLALMAQKQGIAPWAATASAILLQALAVGTGVIVVGIAGTGVLAERHPWIQPGLWGLALLSAIAVGLLVSPAINRYITRRALKRENLGSPRPRAVLFGILVNLAAWVGYGTAFWLLQRGAIPSVSLSLSTAIGSFTASYLAGLLFLLAPGGLLVREGVLVLMLQGSIGLGAAGALAVASRLMLTLTEVGVAVPFLVISTERRRVSS